MAVINGASGNDILTGTSGNDTISSFGGDDRVSGNAGNDLIIAEVGEDFYNGGAGIDTIDYSYYSNGIVADLTNGLVYFLTIPDIEDVISFENIIGCEGGDYLIGTAGNNYLSGNAGDDVLVGVSSDNGRNSIDTLRGGSGSDLFILGSTTTVYYNDGNNSNSGTRDYAVISDYTTLQDTIRLQGSASDYLLRSSPISKVKGTAIYFDSNGNKAFDSTDELVAIVSGISGLNLTSSDFTYV
ncbi:MAG: hypothetical protein V7L20_26410 [Nostoc sp.]|uniref:calcium-binding protein n=1 Tax=Nostoc sp. TaxID=1180 RepID=UPI002FFC0C65